MSESKRSVDVDIYSCITKKNENEFEHIENYIIRLMCIYLFSKVF